MGGFHHHMFNNSLPLRKINLRRLMEHNLRMILMFLSLGTFRNSLVNIRYFLGGPSASKVWPSQKKQPCVAQVRVLRRSGAQVHKHLPNSGKKTEQKLREAIAPFKTAKARENVDVQGSSITRAPGCENAAGKLRQKW